MDIRESTQLTKEGKPLKMAEALESSKKQFIRTMQKDIESLKKVRSAKPSMPKADQVKKAAPPTKLPVVEPSKRPVSPPFSPLRLKSAEGLKKETEIKKRIKETQKRLEEERMRAEMTRQKTEREKIKEGRKKAKKAEPVPPKKKPSFISRFFRLFRPGRPVKPSKPIAIKLPVPPKPVLPKPVPPEPIPPKPVLPPRPIPPEPVPSMPTIPKPTIPRPILPKPVLSKKELPLKKEVKPAIKRTRLKFILISIGTIVVIAGIGGFLYWWNYLRVIPPVAMHYQCQDFQCVSIEEEGEDQCLTDENCQPIEPTVPEPLIPADETRTIELTIGQENLLPDDLKLVAVQEQTLNTFKRILAKLVSQTEKKYADLDTLASALGINLPNSILFTAATSDVEGGNYTLYFYSQLAGNRLVMVIALAEDVDLSQELLIWEANIKTDLKAFFLGLDIETQPTATEGFQDNVFQDIAIRYLNFSSPDLSIDYAIVGNKLVITTSRESMYATIDALLAVEACAQEREMISTTGEPVIECCVGLKAGGSYTIIEEECYLDTGVAICIDCPNDECGLGENICNCPEDCQGIE
ncbi:MAG: hypothetical protein ISS88_01535 [Candidatus Portnoybacteria bacterium]|nr:hypothetical protein [Candidatus Portnoybacteria bacterium]